jgi:hypothetical protein
MVGAMRWVFCGLAAAVLAAAFFTLVMPAAGAGEPPAPPRPAVSLPMPYLA